MVDMTSDRAAARVAGRPVQQDWVCELTMMQQSVLFSSIRGPDGVPKGHPVKPIIRWFRRCTLLSAFDRRALSDPFEPGGGSFTGPYTEEHAKLHFGTDAEFNQALEIDGWDLVCWKAFHKLPGVYLRHVDELPFHFMNHLLQSSLIVATFHPNQFCRDWWQRFYDTVVNDLHLHPEDAGEMARRLSDNEAAWAAREKPGKRS